MNSLTCCLFCSQPCAWFWLKLTPTIGELVNPCSDPNSLWTQEFSEGNKAWNLEGLTEPLCIILFVELLHNFEHWLASQNEPGLRIYLRWCICWQLEPWIGLILSPGVSSSKIKESHCTATEVPFQGRTAGLWA